MHFAMESVHSRAGLKSTGMTVLSSHYGEFCWSDGRTLGRQEHLGTCIQYLGRDHLEKLLGQHLESKQCRFSSPSCFETFPLMGNQRLTMCE